MKKIFAILALAVAGSAFAGSATVEYQTWENPTTKADTGGLLISVRENITKSLVGDITASGNQADSTKTLGGRTELGLTYSAPVGPVTGYVRGATGIKFTNGADHKSYYSVEPGVAVQLTNSLTAKVGYRFRDAFDSGVADQTRTVRAGLGYALTRKDSLGLRFDRQRGDSEQNIWAVSYTRSF